MTNEPRWHTSSHSNNGGDCVEIAANLATTHGIVPVRDSKNPHGPALALPAAAFTTFMAGIKAGAIRTV